MTIQLNIKIYINNFLTIIFRLSRKIVWKYIQFVFKSSNSKMNKFNNIFFDNVLRLKIVNSTKNHLHVIDVFEIFKRIISIFFIDDDFELIATRYISSITQHWYFQWIRKWSTMRENNNQKIKTFVFWNRHFRFCVILFIRYFFYAIQTNCVFFQINVWIWFDEKL